MIGTQHVTWFLLLVLLSAHGEEEEDNCPSRCVCTETRAYCDYIGMRTMPKNFSPKLQFLYLRDNNIRKIQANRLRGLHDLRHLLLKGNKLRNIDKKAFRDTTKLVSLSLTDNNLRAIPPSTFLPLLRLRVMSIRNNKLSKIEGLFTFLNKLQLLNLGNNRIKEISSRTFIGTPSLEILDMHNNNIRTIAKDAFSALPKLKFLVLRGNFITDLDIQFAPAVALELLDLSHCRLRKVPSGLPHTIVDLRLTKNKIREITKRDFENTTRIRLLVLTGNEIHNVENGAFSGMSDLYDLYMVSNHIQDIPLGLPSNIHGFYANFNNITRVREGTFARQDKMEYLYIRDNNINYIEQTAFQGLHHLRALDISRNRVKNVKSYTFSQMPDLELLDVSKNPLNIMEKGSFRGLRGLNILQMASVSPVTPLPHDLFNDLQRLRFLDLSSSPELVNKLFEAPEQLYPLRNVEDLNLMNNKLKNIPEMLPRILPNVRSLKIVGNPWHCDTGISTLLSWLRNGTSTDFYGRSYLTCASPPQLEGQIVQELHPEELPQPTRVPIYDIDEPGFVFTIVNEGDQSVDISIIADSGNIYHGRPDGVDPGTIGRKKVRVITGDGEPLDISVMEEDGVEVENVDTFDRNKEVSRRRSRKHLPGKQIRFRGGGGHSPRKNHQGLSGHASRKNSLPLDLDTTSSEILHMRDSNNVYDSSGYTSGDHG